MKNTKRIKHNSCNAFTLNLMIQGFFAQKKHLRKLPRCQAFEMRGKFESRSTIESMIRTRASASSMSIVS